MNEEKRIQDGIPTHMQYFAQAWLNEHAHIYLQVFHGEATARQTM